MKHFHRICCTAIATAVHASLVFAQPVANIPDASGQVQKSIDRSFEPLRQRPASVKPVAPVDVMGLESSESIDKLLAVQIQDEHLQGKVQAYWSARIGQAVAAEDVQIFHAWVFDEARRTGYLSYATTSIDKRAEGSVLVVKIVRPTIHSIRVISPSGELLTRYSGLVTKRLEQDFRPGQPLDTLGLDQRLDSASYDLPVELDATIRAVAPAEIDLVVTLHPVPSRSGQLLDSLVQVNNYGLHSYGRPQILGSMTIGGHQPKATLNLVGQKSEGITYGRAEYDFASYGNGGHWRYWGSASDSHSVLGGSAATKGETRELGVGWTKVVGGYRDFVFHHHLDASVRTTENRLASTNAITGALRDNQVRIRASADNSMLTSDSSRAEFVYTVGQYNHVDSIDIENLYSKMELNLRHHQSWSQDRSWYSVFRFRGQVSSSRLDSYNQLALGGTTGVRAYTTVDGIGDNGGVLNLEINRRLPDGNSVGAFYDAGVIKLLSPKAGSLEYGQHYWLQALGLQISGQHQNLFYNASLAKGIGGHKGWNSYNIESTPNNWRLYANATYRF